MRSGQDLIVLVIAFCSTAVAIPSRFPRLLPQTLAGAEGFEPPSSVLETDSLTVELTPLKTVLSCRFSVLSKNHWLLTTDYWLLHFFMRRVLPAPGAEFLLLDAVRRRLPILHGRVVPLFALATLQRNNLSGHETQLLAASS